MTTLNSEEKELLNSIENQEWQSVNNLEQRKLTYQNYAKTQIQQQIIEIML